MRKKFLFKYLGDIDSVRSIFEFMEMDDLTNEYPIVERPKEVPSNCEREGRYLIRGRNKGEYEEYLFYKGKWRCTNSFMSREFMICYCNLYPSSFSKEDMNNLFKYKKYIKEESLDIARAYRIMLNLRESEREARKLFL